MAYRNGYRRGRSYPQTAGRVAKANARPGPCHYCGLDVAAGEGQLWRNDDGTWSTVHVAATWAGSPVSGRWVGGCPEEASISLSAANREAPRDRSGGYVDECGSCGMASCAC